MSHHYGSGRLTGLQHKEPGGEGVNRINFCHYEFTKGTVRKSSLGPAEDNLSRSQAPGCWDWTHNLSMNQSTLSKLNPIVAYLPVDVQIRYVSFNRMQ